MHLYTLLLIFRLAYDMQDQCNASLIDPVGECTSALLNLVITGKANPYLHNGIMITNVDDDFDVSIWSRSVCDWLLKPQQDSADVNINEVTENALGRQPNI